MSFLNHCTSLLKSESSRTTPPSPTDSARACCEYEEGNVDWDWLPGLIAESIGPVATPDMGTSGSLLFMVPCSREMGELRSVVEVGEIEVEAA